MTDQTPQPDRDKPENVAESNVQRLLSNAYRPEDPDPAFADRLTRAMVHEAAGRRSQVVRRRRPSQQIIAWAVAATILLALGAALGHFLSAARRADDRPRQTAGQDFSLQPKPRPAVSRTVIAASDWGMESPLTPRPRTDTPKAPELAVGDSLQTGPAERRKVELPDGSNLYLNSNTQLTLEASDQISLDQGEIYLEVSPRHGEDSTAEPGLAGSRPSNHFVVVTPDRELLSLGTRFNVRTGTEGTSLAVTQGKVQVSGVKEPLQAGQQLAASKNATPTPIGQAFHVIGWTRDLVTAYESPIVPASNYKGGALVAKRPDGQEASLSMRRYHVDVHIEDGFARTTIDQTYFNHETSRLEGTFFFPLPPDASLSRLAMYVSGKLMEGGMAEREHARRTFESIVSKQKDPALLEWIDGTTFRMRVFPLEGRQEKRIVLSYTQRLERLGDRTEYRFPGGHSMTEVGHWSCHVRLKNSRDCGWEADSCDFKPDTEEEDLLLDAAADNVMPDRNVVLRIWDHPSGGNGDQPDTQFVSADHEGGRYLALRYPFQPGGGGKTRRDWVFLYEASADRDPVLARVQVDVIKTLLENAERDDTFTVLAASSQIRTLAEKPLAVRPKNVERAVEFLEKTQLVGALDLEKAFTVAAAIAREAQNPCLVHLGSGYPKLGQDDHESLARLLPEEITYVGVAVGNHWNRALMKRLAGNSGGYVGQINPNEPVAWRAIELISRLNAPRLTNARVVDDREKLQFLSISDVVCQGEDLFSVARLDAGAPIPESVDVTGLVDGKPFSKRLSVRDVAQGANHLPRTWSKLEIDRLVADDPLGHHDEIVNLSMAMYVMSPFTSLLVLENDAMYEQYHVDRGRKDHWAMYPCPATIEVVHEPLPEAPEPAAESDTARTSIEDILKTILVRRPWNTTVSELSRLRYSWMDSAGSNFARGRHLDYWGFQPETERPFQVWGRMVTEADSGAALPGQLPYLNGLFGDPAIGRETQSLMMMVTPRIIIQEEEERPILQRSVVISADGRYVRVIPTPIFSETGGINMFDVGGFGGMGFGGTGHAGSGMFNFGQSITVGMSHPNVFSADLDIPFELSQFGLDIPQAGGWGRDMGSGYFGRYNPADYLSRHSYWDGDFDGTFADMTVPAAPVDEAGSFAFEIEALNKAFQEMIDSETRNVIDHARRSLETDPGTSIYNLKQQIETVRGLTELDPDRTDQLLGMLRSAVRQAQQRKGIIEKRNQEQQERIAVAREQEFILSEIEQGEDKTKQLMQRFNSLMQDGKYRYSEDTTLGEIQLRDPNYPGGIGRTFNARSIDDLTDAMVLRVKRQKGVVDALYQTELGHVPFPNDPPILYPPAEVWAELTARRHDRYRLMDLADSNLARKDIRIALDETTVTDFTDEPLGDVVQFLSEYHHIDIRLATGYLQEAGISPHAKVSIQLSGISLRSALRLILGQVNLTYVVTDDCLLILPPQYAGRFVSFNRSLHFRSPKVDDLLVYAPAMHTTMADVLAVLDAEAEIDGKSRTGRIDPRARQLIDSTRRGGWRRLISEQNEGLKTDVAFDGQGRFRVDSETSLGLKETVASDGTHLWHLYPELGVGASRINSRFYQNLPQALVPWLLPAADQLARGADVVAVDDRTVAIVPRAQDTATQDHTEPPVRIELRLVFSAVGRLAERQLVRSDSHKVLLRETYDSSGTLRLLDAEGKERLNRTIVTEPCEVPDLQPDPSLVVLPLPWRTREHVLAARGLKDDGAHKNWSTEDALAVLAAETAAGNEKILSTIGWCFLAKGDRRPGFYTLLLTAGVKWDAKPDDDPYGVRHLLAPLQSTPDELIAHYVTALQKSQSGKEKIGPLGGPSDAFPGRLAQLHDVWFDWRQLVGKKLSAEELANLEHKTVELVSQAPSAAFAASAMAAVAQYGGKDPLARIGDKADASLRQHGPSTFRLRLLHAEAVAETEKTPRGRQLFLALVDDMLAAHIVPRLSPETKGTFFPANEERDVWQAIVDRITNESVAHLVGPQALSVAFSLHQLGAKDHAERIFASVTASTAAHGPGPETLVAVGYLRQTGQRPRAESMLGALMDTEPFQNAPTLWCLAARLAEEQGRLARAAECLDRALALQFGRLPEEVNLDLIRTDYGKLLALFDQSAQSSRPSDPQSQATQIARIVSSADRWRSLDPQSAEACRLAGAALARLGAVDLAWDYVTSPLATADQPPIDWSDLAGNFHQQGQYELADRAYGLAFIADSTNAEILWNRARARIESGRGSEARDLLQTLASGPWNSKYGAVQQQARRALASVTDTPGGSPPE